MICESKENPLHSWARPRNVPSAALRHKGRAVMFVPPLLPLSLCSAALQCPTSLQINTGPFCYQQPTAPLLSTLPPPPSFSYYYWAIQVKGDVFGVYSVKITFQHLYSLIHTIYAVERHVIEQI